MAEEKHLVMDPIQLFAAGLEKAEVAKGEPAWDSIQEPLPTDAGRLALTTASKSKLQALRQFEI